MNKIILSIIFLLSLCLHVNADNDNSDVNRHTISGSISNQNNGELLIGATVYIEELKSGTTSNTYGFYSISLPPGGYNILYSFIGYQGTATPSGSAVCYRRVFRVYCQGRLARPKPPAAR